MRRLPTIGALALAALLLGSGAGGDDKHGDRDCHIRVSDLRFGSYNPNLPQDKHAQTEVEIDCDEDRSKGRDDLVRVTVSEGRSNDCRNRYMQRSSGGNRIYYNVYRDAALTQVTGDSRDGCVDLVPPFRVDDDDKFEIEVTLYGSIPSGQYIPAGSYFDTLTVEVEFLD